MSKLQALRKARQLAKKNPDQAYVVYSREWNDQGFAVCSLDCYYNSPGIFEKDVVAIIG